MAKKDIIEEKAWVLVCKAAESLGYIPVDAEYVKEAGDYHLNVTIDKEGGIGINDCEAMSRLIDPMLDEENFISDQYILIVTSPGLGRPLKRPRDFAFAMGKEIEVHTYKAIEDQKEWRGILKAYDGKQVTFETGNGELTLARTDVSKINLAFDF